MNILEKKSYPRETVMNTAVVDRTNAHIMQLQTTHISELDQKIETLNGRISGYLSRGSYPAGYHVWKFVDSVIGGRIATCRL